MTLAQPKYGDGRGPDSQMPLAILFDWDNTLVDTWPTIHAALNDTLAAMGHVPWTISETRQRVRESMRDSFPKLFGADWERAGEIFYERFEAIHLEALAPCPGAETMLRDIADQGIYLGVVSNKRGDYLRAEAEHLGWLEYFGRLIGATDANNDKPAADAIHMALDGSGISAGETVWFAGDTDTDLECAVNAGCLPILVRDLPPAAEEFDAFPPAWYFSSCTELSSCVSKLEERSADGIQGV